MLPKTLSFTRRLAPGAQRLASSVLRSASGVQRPASRRPSVPRQASQRPTPSAQRPACSVQRLAPCVFALLLLVPAVSAANFTTAEGGNVTQVDLQATQLARNWQGLVGQVSFGTNASAPSVISATGRLVNASSLFFRIDCDNPISASGFIFLSNSSAQPSDLAAGDLTLLDDLFGNDADNGSATFTTTSSFALSTGTIANVPTTFTFVNNASQNSSFREGYFNQAGNLVFATVIEADLQGYNTSFFDYQIIVPAPNLTTLAYFVFSDLAFTCPVVVAPRVGGGQGARRFYEALRRRVIPPREEFVEPISETVIEEVLKQLALRFGPAAGLVLRPQQIDGVLINDNEYAIEDVRIEVDTPEMLMAPTTAHPYKKLFWNIGGWSDHGVPRAQVLAWGVSGLHALGAIAPKSITPVSFTLTPPLMQSKRVDIAVYAFAGPARIASTSIQFSVDVPPFGIVAGQNDRGVLTVYHVVDNRQRKGKDINIELALNRGQSTLVAEVLGPLHVPANMVAIFGHNYLLGAAAQNAEVVDARLLSPEGIRHAQYWLR